jgi:hypothetical protein
MKGKARPAATKRSLEFLGHDTNSGELVHVPEFRITAGRPEVAAETDRQSREVSRAG